VRRGVDSESTVTFYSSVALPRVGTVRLSEVSLPLVPQRTRNPWLVLIEDVLFRVAFVTLILAQFIVFALLVIGIAFLLPRDSVLTQKILLGLFFAGPFLIGASSYLIFQRLTPVGYVLSESKKWLAERHHSNPRRIKTVKAIKRWVVWIPTITVIVICIFFDDAWAVTSHLLHPRRGRLIGYEVSIPLQWAIDGNAYMSKNFVVAGRYRGLLKAGGGLYIGRRPPFSYSLMNFRSAPEGDPLALKPASPIISERTLPLGNGTILCWEEIPPHWMTEKRYIHCFTSRGDFSANFSGSDEDAAEFYRTFQSVKILPTESSRKSISASSPLPG
jgi:hypothetical protein